MTWRWSESTRPLESPFEPGRCVSPRIRTESEPATLLGGLTPRLPMHALESGSLERTKL